MRLRLRLALLTMAVVPVAISLALVYVSAGGQTGTATNRAANDSSALASAVAVDLERVQSALVLLAADPAMNDVASERDPAPRTVGASVADARSALLTMARVGGEKIAVATLLDVRGRARLRVTGGRLETLHASDVGDDDADVVATTMALPTGEVFRSRPYLHALEGATADRRVTFATRLPPAAPGGRSAGVLRLELSLAPMLREAAPNLLTGSRYTVLLDEMSGTILVDNVGKAVGSGSGAGAGTEPGAAADAAVPSAATLLSLLEPADGSPDTGPGAGAATGAGQAVVRDGWSVGITRLTAVASASPGWTILTLDRFTAPPLPFEMMGMLAVLSLVLFVLTRWMARQVLRPAEHLEHSRKEMRRLYEAARADSLRDGLTNLGNHRAFQEELDRQLEWFRRYRVPVALMLIDLDDLKLVNDSRGHAAGDEMLREMGSLISETVRYADRAFRIGGDEFAVLMPHTDGKGALELARRLLANAMRPGTAGRGIPFSAGTSACPALADSKSQLYGQADAALYWCKRHGRASVDMFDPARDREAEVTVADGMTAAVARVVEERLLRPVYQPVVDVASGRIIGYEGLIRPTEASGFPHPGALFGAAETVGRTVELDHACMEIVIEGAQAIAPHEWLSVNLSPRTIEAADFGPEKILTLLRRFGIAPERIVVELTERENVHDLERVRRNLLNIQAAGMRIAADDVGAGNAGLRLLSQVRFDIVKIDLALVQEGATNKASLAVLRSLCELANGWHAYVIAEGLETVEQLRVVRELGVDAGQGYLLGKPLPDPTVAPVDVDGLLRGVRTLGGPVFVRPSGVPASMGGPLAARRGAVSVAHTVAVRGLDQ